MARPSLIGTANFLAALIRVEQAGGVSMRLILVDRSDEIRRNFFPLALSRPLWQLRCGITTLEEKLAAKIGADDAAYFVPDYIAPASSWRRQERGARAKYPVNDMSALAGDDLILVDPLVKVEDLRIRAEGKSEVGLDEQGRVFYARIVKNDLKKLVASSIEEFVASAKLRLPNVTCKLRTWEYLWDLVLANADQITSDFAAAGKCGIEGKVEKPGEILGSKTDIFVGSRARVHPMVVIDAENGPVYIDEGAEIQPFSRIEGPCYIGKESILLGAKCRSGNTFGPCCRIGGEVEESIIHGYSNKYHDGFIGHSYIGEWVNLGALTTNSDLKNDYSTVSITLEGQGAINTGSTKVGSFIGDHTKTSIGTLLNTGCYIGAMAIIMATGKPLPKFIPSFAWFVEGVVTKGFGRTGLYETAKVAMSRRGREWTAAEQAMWDAIFQMTAPARDEAIKRGRKAMFR
jgi:UDP-N-acetylglucosamine diphosphorylase/glucosamine-1-phosphate N-acetyltransferase